MILLQHLLGDSTTQVHDLDDVVHDDVPPDISIHLIG